MRKVVRLNAEENGYRIVNDSDLACRYAMLPNF